MLCLIYYIILTLFIYTECKCSMPKLLQLCSIICIHSCIIYSYIVLHYIIVTNQFWEFLLYFGTHALTILASLSLSQRMAKAKTFKQKLDALKNPSLYMVHPVCCVLSVGAVCNMCAGVAWCCVHANVLASFLLVIVCIWWSKEWLIHTPGVVF